MFRSQVNFNGFPLLGSNEHCVGIISSGTVHARSSLLTSCLSESGVLTKRDMQNMQGGGGQYVSSHCHRRTIFGFPKNHYFLSMNKKKLCNGNVPRMFKALHGPTDANKGAFFSCREQSYHI